MLSLLASKTGVINSERSVETRLISTAVAIKGLVLLSLQYPLFIQKRYGPGRIEIDHQKRISIHLMNFDLAGNWNAARWRDGH